mgnify:CR=1 FL=1|tara:strand:+ start:1178 stop:1900 length:723 start_codon:yes stop_codon:yes gene_type:complete
MEVGRRILLILGLMLAVSSKATTFIPLPVEDQIDASDAVVWATNQSKTYKKLPSGEVVTEYSFKLKLASGLPEHKVTSPNSFKVLAPGGLWMGRYYQFHGVASFEEGESALLFLKQTPHGWFVNNLSMGKYEIIEDARGTWFKNTVFPEHPKLGLVSLNDMNHVLERKFETPLVQIDIDKYVHKQDFTTKNKTVNGRDIQRQPASIDEVIKDNEKSLGILWMMLFLGFLGFIYRVRAKKS